LESADLVAQALVIAGDVSVEETAHENSVVQATSVEEAIGKSTTLSAGQRARWLEILHEDDPSSPDDEV
jgi:hypothetical protein